MSHYNRKLELDDALFTKSNNAIVKALKDNKYLTRQELKKILEDGNIKTDVQRLAHIIMWAELEGLIISGPRRGKQFTYALLEERAWASKKRTRDESLATLAVKYFTSHGPAQLKDFSWWSGLSIKDTQTALDMIKPKLTAETVENRTFYFIQTTKKQENFKTQAFLLSIYDEYTIAYKDRSDLSDKRDIERLISMGNALTAVIILNGKVLGTWKRDVKKDTVMIKASLFRDINTPEKKALEKASDEYGKFLGLKPTLDLT
jgi:hypothetical protein